MSGKRPPSLYDVLGLSPGASEQDVRRARRRLAQQHHPDRGDATGSEAMALINHAHDVLSDPHRRALYDAGRQPPGGPRRPGRVTLPGDRIRQRLLWAAAGFLVAALLAGVLARSYLVGEAAGRSARGRVEGTASAAVPRMPQAAAPLPVRAGEPGSEAPLRLIPAARIEVRPAHPVRPRGAPPEGTIARQP